MAETPTFGRYAEIPYDEMTPEQQEGYRFLVETRGAAGGPSKIWVHNPKLVKASAQLGAHFHPGGYSLSEREREIAVIIINSKWHSAYPTNAHERRGNEVGLPAATVAALLSGLPASFSDSSEGDALSRAPARKPACRRAAAAARSSFRRNRCWSRPHRRLWRTTCATAAARRRRA